VEVPKKQHNLKTIITFILPSLIGLMLFMLPISYDGAITIPIAVLAKMLQAALADKLTLIVTIIIVFMAFSTVLASLIKPKFVTQSTFFTNLLLIPSLWVLMRILGAVFVVMTYLQMGPEIIYSSATGALVLNDLLPVLFSVFMLAGILLPLLVNFGLLEFFGTMMTKIMRPVFNLPGRSAIDCIASWLGDGSVGILMTNKQYETRFYTQREAAVIGTTFSAVSITFSLVVISQVKLEYLFIPFYLTVCLAGVVAAVIVPKLPPLSWKKDNYIDDTPRHADDEMIPTNYNVVSWGYEQALEKADKAGGVKHLFQEGAKNAVDMIFGIIPAVMAIGTIALILAEHTPIFNYLGMPFVPLLELLQIPEAVDASKTIVVGFADMFIPSILASSIESDLTRFVIAALSVTQLIYMSEVGALLLGSKIPVNFLDLFVVFILRTLVTLPVIAGAAHLLL
jgi:nucleoside recognition membrane protein YjiH